MTKLSAEIRAMPISVTRKEQLIKELPISMGKRLQVQQGMKDLAYVQGRYTPS